MAEKNKKRFQELSRKIQYGDQGGGLSNAKVAYQKWLNKNTGIKLLGDGKRQTVWKTGETKGQVFDEKAGLNQFNQQYYGTTTPRKDLKFLQQEATNALKIRNMRTDGVRTRLSKKDFEGKNIYQQEIDLKEKKLAESLDKLRIGTSFENKPVEEQPEIEKAVVTDPAGDAFNEEAFIEAGAHEWGDAGQPSAEIQNQLAAYGSPDTINTSLGSSSAGTNGTSTRDRLKVAQDAIEANPTRIQRGLIDSGFTAERLADLRIKQQDFKSMNRQDFAAKYSKSQTAKRLNKKRK